MTTSSKLKVLVAHGQNSIVLMHSIIPFLIASQTNTDIDWQFYNFVDCYGKINSSGDTLIIIRKYKDIWRSDKEYVTNDLIDLKKRFNKVIYFDDSAGSNDIHFEFFQHIDYYWKRSRLCNDDEYFKPMYGTHPFSDYYHREFDIVDSNEAFSSVCVDKNDLKKIKVAWNIGAGLFPSSFLLKDAGLYTLARKVVTFVSLFGFAAPSRNLVNNYIKGMVDELSLPVDLSKKKNNISARLTLAGYSNSIGAQRKFLADKIGTNTYITTALTSKRHYLKEMRGFRSTLSPFGWGEVCYRDFEAALSGSLLIKPSMSHINTWPNIYDENAYCSLNWDLSDFNIKDLRELPLEKISLKVNIARNVYKKSLAELGSRATSLVLECSGD